MTHTNQYTLGEMTSDELRQAIRDLMDKAIDADSEIRTAQARFRATGEHSDPGWYNDKQTERRRLLLSVRTMQDELRERQSKDWYAAFYEVCRVRFDDKTLADLAQATTRITNLLAPTDEATCEICETPMRPQAEGLRCPRCDGLAG